MARDKYGVLYASKKGVTDREYQTKRRRECIVRGVCPSHPSTSVVEGCSRCQQCIDDALVRREYRRANGICMSHIDRKILSGYDYCFDCVIKRKMRELKGANAEEIEKATQAWVSFDGRCQACGTNEPGTKGWVIDHDHDTLKFRGILCSACNLALGHAKDSVVVLKSLVTYLMRKINE